MKKQISTQQNTPVPDRKKPPAINSVSSLNWNDPVQIVTEKGIPIYIFHNPAIDAVQLNLSFPGGMYSEKKPLVATTTINTLREGTQKHSSKEIAEKFDFWGSYLNSVATRDSMNISLFFLNRYASENISLLTETLVQPAFPEKEVSVFLKNRKEDWQIKNEQVSFLSRVHFLEQIYGTEHPYGRKVNAEDFDRVTTDDLRICQKNNLHDHNVLCILSGNITEKITKILASALESLPRIENHQPLKPGEFSQMNPSVVHIEKPDAMQTSIHTGKRMFNRNHKDFTSFQVLNTLLGGYFGSRLMQNLREEKGLTYGIYSSLISLKYDGIFSIAAEVAADSTEIAVLEIIREIEKLRSQTVPEDELQRVKNYYMGNLLQTIDGVLNKADLVRSLLVTGTPFTYFSRLTDEINAVTPERIRELAIQYLDPETLTIVTAGKK